MLVQPSVINGLTIVSFVMVFGFLWRTASGKLADKPIGQAMAFIY